MIIYLYERSEILSMILQRKEKTACLFTYTESINKRLKIDTKTKQNKTIKHWSLLVQM